MGSSDVGSVIEEMKELGIHGFSEKSETAVIPLDVIKKGTENEGGVNPRVTSFGENQERAKIVVKRMSAIADRISEVSVGLRENLREADSLLREMDEAASEFRRISNE